MVTKMAPYEVFYGQQPPLVSSYLPSTSKVQEVESLHHNCQLTLAFLKANLAMDQNRMKKQDYQHHSEWYFEVTDKVFLWIQPYKNNSLKPQGNLKLALKLYVPY
jgi:hypothetical protein